MAETINFPGANVRLDAPPGLEEQVHDIVAYKGPCTCGDCPEQVVTCWRLSPEELEQVKKTGVVWLYLMGPSMQPAYIGTDSPFHQEDQS